MMKLSKRCCLEQELHISGQDRAQNEEGSFGRDTWITWAYKGG
jgi:hypothetical protein